MGAPSLSNLIIRADASITIGTGHVMRCLSLAQAWQDSGGRPIFVTTTESPALEERLRSEGIHPFVISAKPGTTDDAIQTAHLAKKVGADWVILDGYYFDSSYQYKVKGAGHRLMVIDDMAYLSHYYADIVLNQNMHAMSLKYSYEPYTKLLLGTRYVLLRKEFLKWQRWIRRIPAIASKVLVTLGGGDSENVTMKVIQAFKEVNVDGIEVTIVIGPTNPHLETIKKELSHVSFAYRLLPSVRDMAELMAWADLAVSAGGSTCWEMAFMGLPSLLLILADNQRPIAQRLHSARIATNLGWHQDVSTIEIVENIDRLAKATEIRTDMVREGQNLVDGDGTARLLMSLRGESFRLRKVRQGDCELIWEWANDPETRALSFSSEVISWEQHVQWFESKLNDPRCIYFIAVDDKEGPIGQVRYDIVDREAVISVSIAVSLRGKGYGSTAIRLASQRFLKNSDVELIRAYIKPENASSKRAFLKAGFQEVGLSMVKESKAMQLVFSKSDLT